MTAHQQLFHMFLLLVPFLLCACAAASISVLPVLVNNPTPDGSGVVFLQLQVDPTDPNKAGLDHFRVASLTLGPTGQAFKLWDATNHNCNGATLSANSLVPADGKICFWADTSSTPEFESFLTYVAADSTSEEGDPQEARVVTYNVQTCPAIPDLGGSGFVTVPSSPTVSITLLDLKIKFEVTVAYVRNQTAWMIDFFDFNSTANGHSADGTGRTCSNHMASTFAGLPFSRWWSSQPRANFDPTTTGETSIRAALDSTAFPMYKPSGTNSKWTITAVGCDQVKFTATIPTVNLIAQGASDCTAPGASGPAAAASGLNYTANLFVFALRPKDLSDSSKGYFKASFVYPFKFRLQQTVEDIAPSPTWPFHVRSYFTNSDVATSSLTMTVWTVGALAMFFAPT